MKKKKNQWLMPLLAVIIVILLILIFFTKAIPLGFLGNFSFLPFKIQFSAFGDDDLPDSDDKDQEEDCKDINIAEEYRDFYGDAFINAARDSCNLNGVYQEDDDILGCSFDKDSLTVDCNTAATDNLENFCERLDATWICSNSQGFVGCVCERSAPGLDCWWQKIDEINMVLDAGTTIVWFEDLPRGKYRFDWSYDLPLNTDIVEDPIGDNNIWNYDDEKSGSHTFIEDETTDEWGIQVENIWRSNSEITITLYQWVCEGDNLNWGCGLFDEPDYWSGEPIEEEQDYTCGQGIDVYCQGTCPESYYCSEVWFELYTYACTCINSNEEVHPDWKEDGVYHNPQDETPPPEPDEVCAINCPLLHGVSVATAGTGTAYADNWCVVNCGGEGYFSINTNTFEGVDCYCWTCHNEQFNGWTC